MKALMRARLAKKSASKAATTAVAAAEEKFEIVIAQNAIFDETGESYHRIGIYRDTALAITMTGESVLICEDRISCKWAFDPLWQLQEYPRTASKLKIFADSFMRGHHCVVCNSTEIARATVPDDLGGGHTEEMSPKVCVGNCQKTLFNELMDCTSAVLHNGDSLDYALHLIVAAMHGGRTAFLDIESSGFSAKDLKTLFQDMMPAISSMQRRAKESSTVLREYLDEFGSRVALNWVILRCSKIRWDFYTEEEAIAEVSKPGAHPGLLSQFQKNIEYLKKSVRMGIKMKAAWVKKITFIRKTPGVKNPLNFTNVLNHGSSLINWFSIHQTGIRTMSKSKYMSAGAAYGNGIYLSDNPSVSYSYSTTDPSNGWTKSSLGLSSRMYAICHTKKAKLKCSASRYFVVVENENVEYEWMISWR